MTASPESQQLGTQPDLAVYNVGCTIVGHQPKNKKVPLDERHEGWFLQVGNANQGVILHMWFPLHEDGRPIMPGAAASLLDRMDPIKMSPGQWQLLFAEYQASCVEALSSVESLSVDTGVPVSLVKCLEDGAKDSWDFEVGGKEARKLPVWQTVIPEESSPGLDSLLMDLPPCPEMSNAENETIEALFRSDGVEVGREALDQLLHSVDLHMERQQQCLVELHHKFGNVNQRMHHGIGKDSGTDSWFCQSYRSSGDGRIGSHPWTWFLE